MARVLSKEVLATLNALSDPIVVSSMARFGIKANKAFGVSVPGLRKLAKSIGKDHALSQELWDTGLHEARELATMIAEPEQVTEELMERWVKDLDSIETARQIQRLNSKSARWIAADALRELTNDKVQSRMKS